MDALRKQSGFAVGDKNVRCPDGRVVEISDTDPLSTIGQLVQEDFCLLQKRGGEHVLVAAVLCFPASWTLAEKLGKPLGRIHAPVQSYDAGMAIRVQRLFDAVQTGNPLWRVNALAYEKPWLFQPRREADAGSHRPSGATFLRSELQTIRLLRDAKTIAFGIHTYVTDIASLPASDQLAFKEWARGETRA